MPAIEIYSSDFCPYCARAKALLRKKGMSFTEIDVISSPQRRAEMRDRAGGRNTVPQIFIDGQHVGGCDDIHALDASGQLNPMLGLA